MGRGDLLNHPAEAESGRGEGAAELFLRSGQGHRLGAAVDAAAGHGTIGGRVAKNACVCASALDAVASRAAVT